MTDRPSAFSRTVEQLDSDLGRAARTWTEESRLVRDEAVGAELLLARELVEQFGILFETVDQLNDLAIRQAGHLFRDYATTLRHAASDPGLHNCRDIVLTHWQRRIEHIAEGTDDVTTLLRGEARKWSDALFGLWRPFAAVLGRDWRNLRRDPDRS